MLDRTKSNLAEYNQVAAAEKDAGDVDPFGSHQSKDIGRDFEYDAGIPSTLASGWGTAMADGSRFAPLTGLRDAKEMIFGLFRIS